MKEGRQKQKQVAGCASSKTLKSIPLEIWSRIFGFAILPTMADELENTIYHHMCVNTLRKSITLVCKLFEVGSSQHSNAHIHPFASEEYDTCSTTRPCSQLKMASTCLSGMCSANHGSECSSKSSPSRFSSTIP